MIVNVCPAGMAEVPAQTVWQVLSRPERFGEWTDTSVTGIDPSGPLQRGQRIELKASAFGREWPAVIDVVDLDARDHGWVELRVRLPFGVVNNERLTLTEVAGGRTLVRFN